MSNHHRITRRVPDPARRPRSARPSCEALEGRALLTSYSAFIPTFGQHGAVIGAADAGAGTELSRGYAVAVGRDGKVVEVGTYAPISPTYPHGQLAVRRYNADGSVDTTFGTNGQATIPLPSNAIAIDVGPHNVAVQADGSIFVAATAALTGSDVSFPAPAEGFVAKLTPAGQLDPTFGTGGEYVFAGTTTGAVAVSVAADGKVVVLGGNNNKSAINFGETQSATRNQLVVTRLTTAGAPDATFNGTGSLTIALPAAQLNAGNFGFSTYYNYAPATLAIAPSGQIYVAGNDVVTSPSGQNTFFADLSRVNSNGTLDTSFGTGGTVAVGAYLSSTTRNRPSIRDMAFDPDGKLIVVGVSSSVLEPDQAFLNRLLPDGTLDPTFAGNSTGVGDRLTGGSSYNSVAIGPDGSITVGTSGAYNGFAGVVRYTTAGVVDVGFGMGGRFNFSPSVPVAEGQAVNGKYSTIQSLALTTNGRFVVAGVVTTRDQSYNTTYYNLLAELQPVKVTRLIGDYDGDGVSDVAAYLSGPGVYAYRPTTGGDDVLQAFGAGGAGVSLPAPGDYDGDGVTDLAVYFPSQGKLYYRSSNSGGDIGFTIGTSESIPAPGDYDGDGKTDAAVYDPTTGSFLIRDSSTTLISTVQFGAVGTDASVPAPGDYDGDGTTDLAVYLPGLGVLAYRSSAGGGDVLTSFGLPGDRMSIPAPGDYDGDGKADLAVYLPSLGVYAYRPSSGAAGDPDVLRSFGLVGDGASIPAPGDYDGDGLFDIAVYLPQDAIFAYRPSSAVVAGADALTTFGAVGTGVTIPTASIPYAQPAPVSRMSLAASPEAGVPLALTDDVLELLAGTTGRKRKA